MDFVAIFLTGLLAGALTCLAVQGGLLASTIAQREEEKLKDKIKSRGNAIPLFSFLLTKLIAYTILGFLLGALGSFFNLSIGTQVILQFAVAIFMIGTALALLDIHPIFRYFIIQPPRFLTRLIRKRSKSGDLFAPAMLGAFTVFIPCGTTQAMMALAIASGSPTIGASIMFAFILGTIPLFFVLGYTASKLGDLFQQKFMRLAAFAIIFLAIFNLNNAYNLSGINLGIKEGARNLYCVFAFCDKSQTIKGQAVNEATIDFTEASYSPNEITVKAGTDVRLNLVNKQAGGCIQAFTIPQLGIQKVVRTGTSESINFKAPDQPGEIAFMCSMGMFRGVINVI